MLNAIFTSKSSYELDKLCIRRGIKFSEILINDNFRELPSPNLDLEKRVNWLRGVLPLTWSELLKDKETIDSGVNFIQWKENIINNIYSLNKDTIIFTHFVVINTIIGEILKSDKMMNLEIPHAYPAAMLVASGLFYVQ